MAPEDASRRCTPVSAGDVEALTKQNRILQELARSDANKITRLNADIAALRAQAATIAELTRERDAAREALIPLAEVADHCEHETNPEALVLSRLGDLRHARAALSPTTKGGEE